MSIKWITKVWSDSPFDGTRLLIHLALADISHDDGRFFASQADLAKKGRCTTQYVRLVINEMIEGGYIQIVTKGSSRGKATVYQLIHKELPNSVMESKAADDDQLPNSVGDNSQTLTENSQTPSNNIRPIHSSLSTTKERVEQSSPDILEVCSYLANAIEQRGLRPRPPDASIQGARWLSEARLLLAGKIGKGDTLEDCGSLTTAQIKAAIDYAMNDTFWVTQILSPGKLRKQYPTLRMQATVAKQKSQPKGLKAIMEIRAEEELKSLTKGSQYALQG